MDIKRLFALVAFLFATFTSTLAQGTEEQRKYGIPDPAIFSAFITASGTAGGFSTFHHSEYTYMDIYLDTPDELLFQHGLSLRFRKRFLNDTLVTYGLQLKSEMASDTAVRMEVEEPELDFYQVKTPDGWQPLTEVLDVYFDALAQGPVDYQSPEIAKASALLQEWIRFKAGGVVTPFQRLLHLKLAGLDLKGVQSLKPVICGVEKRQRSHIYSDPANATAGWKPVPANVLPESLRPKFFTEHPDYNWLLESSLDSAVFYPLFASKTPFVAIFEYETENKYCVPATGTQLLSQLEVELRNRFGLQPQSSSKYRRSIEGFRE
ncbi:MAG: hypothetical protein V4604_08170 [Bacteroidota bacterium]